MAKDEVLIFSGAPGCGCNSGRSKSMARKRGFYDPYTRVSVKRRSRRGRRRSFMGIQGFGQTTSIRQSFSAVKDIVYTGAIAGAGAIATDWVWGKIGTRFNLQNEMLALAKIATGIGIGLLVSKFLRKPRLGMALAIGPVVVGVKDMLKGAVGMAGIPDIQYTDRFKRAIVTPPFTAGVPAIGPGTPDWIDVEKVPTWNYAY